MYGSRRWWGESSLGELQLLYVEMRDAGFGNSDDDDDDVQMMYK